MNNQFSDSVAETLDYRLWINRVAGWDGLLPILVSAASVGVAVLFPQNGGVHTIALVALPIAAFLCRAHIGRRQIYGNHCSVWIRWMQLVALGFALLMLVCFDFIVVLMAFVPKGQIQPPPEDVPVCVGMLGAYLFLVIFAMYPGRGLTVVAPDQGSVG